MVAIKDGDRSLRSVVTFINVVVTTIYQLQLIMSG